MTYGAPLSLRLLHLDFTCRNDRLGLPNAVANGKSIDVFAVPYFFCNSDDAHRRSWAFGGELALCTLAWYRRQHVQEATGLLDSAISAPHGCDLAELVHTLCNGGEYAEIGWHFGAKRAYFSVSDDALHHAVTARGDPERDVMIPEQLDTLTNEVLDQRLRSALSGMPLEDLGFRWVPSV